MKPEIIEYLPAYEVQKTIENTKTIKRVPTWAQLLILILVVTGSSIYTLPNHKQITCFLWGHRPIVCTNSYTGDWSWGFNENLILRR